MEEKLSHKMKESFDRQETINRTTFRKITYLQNSHRDLLNEMNDLRNLVMKVSILYGASIAALASAFLYIINR